MKKSLFAIAILATLSTAAGAEEVATAAIVPATINASEAATAVTPTKGKMLYAANGGRLGSVYRVNTDGSVQLILDGSMRTIPGHTLSLVDGKLTTSLSKSDVISH
ncbi:MAG: hypothetical protein QM661_14465 [Solimonas sp.]